MYFLLTVKSDRMLFEVMKDENIEGGGEEEKRVSCLHLLPLQK